MYIVDLGIGAFSAAKTADKPTQFIMKKVFTNKSSFYFFAIQFLFSF